MDTNSPDQDVLDAINRDIAGTPKSSNEGLKSFILLALIFAGLATLLLAAWMGWRSYSSESPVITAPSSVVPPKPPTLVEQELAQAVEQRRLLSNPLTPTTENEHHKHFEAQGALVTNHQVALFLETQTAGGVSPSERAKIVTQRLNETAESIGLDPQNIVARMDNDLATVCYAKPGKPAYVLATIDPKTAAQFGFGKNPALLTLWWRDVLRDHACIIAGNPPIYTTPYSSILQRVYSLCQAEQKGVPTHESFETAIGKLSREEHDALQGLYIQVPTNYRPQTD